MSGSSSQPTQVTKTEPSPEQRELMNIALPGIREFAASTPQRYQGPTVAPFNPAQVAGQEQVLSSVPTIDALAKSGAAANQFYTSGSIWDPASNPNLQGAVDAAVRPIYSNLTEKALPAIRSGSIQSGNFGGSRQGIAEGAAIRDTGIVAGDTASKLVQDQYKTNVQAQLQAMGLLPTVQGAQTTAGTTTSGVGDVRQAMDQALINSQVGGFNFDQYAPFLQSKEIMSMIPGMLGGSTISTANNPTANPFMSSAGGALSGAMTGATLGSVVPGIGTGIGAGVGAVGGALLPFLMNR